MASLSATLSVLANVIQARQDCLHRSRQDIGTCLEACYGAEEIQRWHLDKMDGFRDKRDSENHELKPMCSTIACHLFQTAESAAQLRSWAFGKSLSRPSHPRSLLNEALCHLYCALDAFKVVRIKDVLQGVGNMEVVLTYLKMVYEVMVILVPIAFRPEDAGFFQYWTEYLDITGLEGFAFDDAKTMNKRRDRTLGGVLPPSDSVPASYLPSNPSFPILFRNIGQYGRPVLRNSLFLESAIGDGPADSTKHILPGETCLAD